MAKSAPKASDGFLKLEAQGADAQRRLMIGGASCLAMFILGVALVAFLMPPQEEQLGADAISPTPQVDTASPNNDPAATAGEAAADNGDHARGDEQAPSAGTPKADDEQAGVADNAELSGETGAQGSDPGADEATAEDRRDAPPNDEPPRDEVADTQQGEEPEADEGTGDGDQWWTRIHGKKCRIDFGDHKRLIMREGRLHKDQVTTYGPFVNQPVAARVRESMDPRLTVHHIGIHPRNKRPSLAYVTLHNGDQDIRGILPLQVSGDQLRLIPAR